MQALKQLLQQHGIVNNVLVFSVMFSALSVIFLSHNARSITINKQQLIMEYERLELDQNSLLLEENTFANPSYIEQRAVEMGLQQPQKKQIIYITK